MRKYINTKMTIEKLEKFKKDILEIVKKESPSKIQAVTICKLMDDVDDSIYISVFCEDYEGAKNRDYNSPGRIPSDLKKLGKKAIEDLNNITNKINKQVSELYGFDENLVACDIFSDHKADPKYFAPSKYSREYFIETMSKGKETIFNIFD